MDYEDELASQENNERVDKMSSAKKTNKPVRLPPIYVSDIQIKL